MFVAGDLFVVLVGVDDYTTFDASGARNLEGCVRDVRAYWRLLRRIGVPARNFTVLTSPGLAPSALGRGAERAKHGPATADAIRAALDALAESLNLFGRRGLVVFCGHGDHVFEETTGKYVPVLCPTDVEATPLGTLARAVRLDELHGPQVFAGLAYVVDASFADAGTAALAQKVRCLRGTTLPPVPFEPHLAAPGALVFGAARTGEGQGTSAHEVVLGGRVRGAFSWAFETVLRRWGARTDTETPGYPLSWREAAEAIGGMLRALAAGDEPDVLGPKDADALSVFDSPPYVPEAARDDGRLVGLQVPGGEDGRTYALLEPTPFGERFVGWLVVRNVGTGSWKANTKYWIWKGDPWPASFRAVHVQSAPPFDSPGSQGDTEDHGPFPITLNAIGAEKPGYVVRDGDGAVAGYLLRSGTEQRWLGARVQGGFLAVGKSLTFTWKEKLSGATLFRVYKSALRPLQE